MLICTSSSIARTNSPRMGSLSSMSYCQLDNDDDGDDDYNYDDSDCDLPFQVEIGAGWPKMFAVTDADRYGRLRGMNWFLFCPRFDFILTWQGRINFLYFSPVKIDLLLHEQCFSGTGTILVDHDFLFTVRFPSKLIIFLFSGAPLSQRRRKNCFHINSFIHPYDHTFPVPFKNIWSKPRS